MRATCSSPALARRFACACACICIWRCAARRAATICTSPSGCSRGRERERSLPSRISSTFSGRLLRSTAGEDPEVEAEAGFVGDTSVFAGEGCADLAARDAAGAFIAFGGAPVAVGGAVVAAALRAGLFGSERAATEGDGMGVRGDEDRMSTSASPALPLALCTCD